MQTEPICNNGTCRTAVALERLHQIDFAEALGFDATTARREARPRGLQNALALTALKAPVRLDQTSSSITHHAEVVRQLRARALEIGADTQSAITQGWIETTSSLMDWQTWRAASEETLLLAADIVCGNRSIQLRRVGAGWALTLLYEHVDGTDGELIAIDSSFFHHLSADVPARDRDDTEPPPRASRAGDLLPNLIYRAYYRIDEDGVIEPFSQRLLEMLP